MQKKVLAFLSLCVLILGLIPAAALSVTVEAATTGNTYLVGYGKQSIDPIDPEGTYRTVDLTGYMGSDVTKSAYYYLDGLVTGTGSNGKPTYTYTVADYSDAVGVTAAVPDGYFQVPLGGYAGQEERMSEGIMDDSGDGTISKETDGMRATAIVINDGTNTIALVGIDAISADAEVINTAKTKIHAAIPEISRSNIMVTASHSHSGVYTSVFSTTYSTVEEAKAAEERAAKSAAQRAYRNLMADRIAQAVIDAYNSKAAATIEKASLSIVDGNGKANMNFVRHYNITKTHKWNGTTQTYVSGDNFGGSQTSTGFVDSLIYSYSMAPVSVADNTMHVLRITYDGGTQEPILFANWRAHPKINSTASSAYGKANRSYSSSDYVGAFRVALEEAKGYRVSFYQGAAGNMNAHSNIDSETNSVTKGSNGQEGGLYGSYLAEYAVTAMEKTSFETVTGGEIKVKDTYFDGEGPTYSVKEVEAAKEWKTKYDAGSVTYPFKATNGFIFNSYYHANAVYGRVKNSNEEVTIDGANLVLNVITVGDNLAFVTAPNELYDRYDANGSVVDADNDWKELSTLGYGTPFVLGYTNNSSGYIPNTLAYNYNAGSTTYGQGSYEANTSGLRAGEGERVIATYKAMLSNMDDLDPVKEGRCAACGQDVTWKPLNGIYDDIAIDPGHYYLAEDAASSINYQKQINGTVCIDLNGFTYANRSAVTGKAFVVNSGGTLNIMGEGKVQGQGVTEDKDKSGGVIKVASGGILNLYDSTIERVQAENQLANNGGAVCVQSGGTFNMHSGTVTGGKSEGTSSSGGNIYCAGTFNMEGGTVTGGQADQLGQNVYITSDGTFSMSGGTITGGVHVKAVNNKISLSGSAMIYDANAEKNLFLDNNGSKELGSCNLTEGAKIGISAVRSLASDAYFDYFVADEGTYLQKLGGKIFAGDRYSCECGGTAVGKYGHTCENVVWAPWPGTETPPNGSGNYYLKYNCKPTNIAGVSGTLRVDLNGKTIDRQVSAASNSAVFSVSNANAKLIITDTVGGGTIKRTLSDETIVANHAGTCITVTGSNTLFRLYAGTIDGQGQKTSSGGGGVIAGNNADGTPAVEIYGGTIKGATCNYGGGVYAKGRVLLAGGTIQGGIVNKNGGGVFVDTTGSLILTGDATVTGNTMSTGVDNNIYCPANKLTVTGTYTGTAGIYISSPAAGKVIGISNDADISGANLTVDNESLLEVVTSGTQLKLTNSANAAVKYTNGTDVEYYESMAEALEDYIGGNAYLTLMKPVEDSITLTQPTRIDLAGQSITGTVNYENGATLTIFDSATDDFTVADENSGLTGYGTVPASESVEVATGYYMITENGKISAHRLDLTLKTITLRPSKTGIYYQSRFGGDEIIKNRITEYGVSLRVDSAPDEAYITADTNQKTHAAFDGANWVVGNGDNSAYSVILTGILDPDNAYVINKRNANTKIYGISYAVIDGQMVFGGDRNYSLRDVMECIDSMKFDSLDEKERQGVIDLYDTYQTVMRTWNLPNIASAWRTSTYENLTATFVGDSITYGIGLNDGEQQYWKHLQNDLALGEVTNMGVSGSCISSNNDRKHDYQPLMDRYKKIPGTDLIFIFMGTNDFSHNTMLTTAQYNATYHDNATRTLAVDLNTVIDYLQGTYPASQIVLVTPIERYDMQTNKIGLRLQDYVEAIEAVGTAQGVPVINIYDQSKTALTSGTHFGADRVHPNAEGHVVLAEMIGEQLETMKDVILAKFG